MIKPIYASKEHEVIVQNYITVMNGFITEIATEQKLSSFKKVFDLVVEYHNNYGKGVQETGNYWDWLMILPINLSVMTNGFLAGIETKGNKNKVLSYKVLLNEILHDTVDKLEKLEPIND
jgi:hypothetical protein|tara:strand:- start:25986 stop:26345 length:360 start_codon:yes stop_codon:yes gene_type:complete